MAIIDTSLRRESNCPVHFVWDGNGVGRPVVRLGFLMVLAGGLLVTGTEMLHLEAAAGPARMFLLAGVVVWALGQILTKFAVSFRR